MSDLVGQIILGEEKQKRRSVGAQYLSSSGRASQGRLRAQGCCDADDLNFEKVPT